MRQRQVDYSVSDFERLLRQKWKHCFEAIHRRHPRRVLMTFRVLLTTEQTGQIIS